MGVAEVSQGIGWGGGIATAGDVDVSSVGEGDEPAVGGGSVPNCGRRRGLCVLCSTRRKICFNQKACMYINYPRSVVFALA